jgi:hypothetical protein
MEKNIFYELQNGYAPTDEQRINKTPEEINIGNKIEEERKYFSTIMSDEDFKRFTALEELNVRIGSFEDTRTFARGFRMGAKIMCAVFMDDETKDGFIDLIGQ